MLTTRRRSAARMKSRKDCESRSQAKKSSRGAVIAMAMVTGGRPGEPENAPDAPKDRTNRNQAPRTKMTGRGVPLPGMVLGWERLLTDMGHSLCYLHFASIKGR